MAITDTAHDKTLITRFFGLSTDAKPESAMIGATFYETDTRHSFVFDGEWRRSEQIVVEQSEAVATREATHDIGTLLEELIVQQKKTNGYLSLITEVELAEGELTED